VPRLSLVVLTVAVAVFALGAPGLASADVSGPDIVSFLNAQRVANGIPAGIVEDGALSAGCAAHDNYGALNHVLVHTEDSTKPGYSAAGKAAAETSVLYRGGGPWTAVKNPFEQAPIHLHQLLAPRLDRMGAAETQGFGCATTLASRARPAPAQSITYTYPGDGVQGWVTAQVASEGPYTPGEQVGIAAGTRTGPYLYVSFDGPTLGLFSTAQATGATLTGPDGPVAVLTADNTTPGLTNYLPTGMEVIPRDALKPASTYTASVSATVTPFGGGAAIPFTHAWSFTTGGQAQEPIDEGSGNPPVPPGGTAPGTAGPVAIPAPPPPLVVARPPSVTVAKVLATLAAGATARQRGRRLTVRVRCGAACTLRVAATLTAGKRRTTLPRVSVKRASAGSVTVRFTLSKALARRLRGAHPRRLALTVVARPAKGASTTVRKTVPVTGR
jgi:hypothetical protein